MENKIHVPNHQPDIEKSSKFKQLKHARNEPWKIPVSHLIILGTRWLVNSPIMSYNNPQEIT